MGMFITILLLFLAVSLFVAVHKGWIKSASIQMAANVAGIISLLAALAVFIIPSKDHSVLQDKTSSEIRDSNSIKENVSPRNQDDLKRDSKNITFLDNSSSDSITTDLYSRLKNSIISEHSFHYFGYKSKTIYEEKDGNMVYYEDQNDTITINTNFRDYIIRKDGNVGKSFSQLNETQVQRYKYEIISILKNCLENESCQIDSLDNDSFSITFNEYYFEVVKKDSISSFLNYLDFHENGKQRLFLSGLYLSVLRENEPTYLPLEGTSGLYSLTQKKFRSKLTQ